MAGGSQLKKLKESLKNAGLTGQTNNKKKGKGSKRAQHDMRKDDKQNILQQIREEFNPFDLKITRNKRADALAKKLTVGKPGISKQVGEENRKADWEAKMSRKNKAGAFVDRRFGENNSKLSAEEKMLERFTKERLLKSSKSSMYNLENDDEESFDTLTHFGQSLSTDNKDNNDDDVFFSKKRSVGQNEDIPTADEPQRKKTKAEVMKEVISKSKFYKHERQKKNEMVMEQVEELDDDFDNVMDEISAVKLPKPDAFESKSESDIQYDMKVAEAKLDRRAAPSDRTKTEEELEKEKAEHLIELEQARIRRMEGETEEVEANADDLDDEFWEAASDEGEAEGFTIKDSDEEIEESEQSESEGDDEAQGDNKKTARESENKPKTITIGGKVINLSSSTKSNSIICPKTLEEFIDLTKDRVYKEIIPLIKQVFENYQPKLAEGNKEKIGVFTCILIKYALHLADVNTTSLSEKSLSGYTKLMEFLTKTIRDLGEKYPELYLEEFKSQLLNVQERIENRDSEQYPRPSDLILFTIIGRTFSTSDLYHLVVTPSLVVICESLEFMKIDKFISHLFSGVYICDLLLQYQRISRRLIPEVINFLERALLALIPEPGKIDEWEKLASRSRKPQVTKFSIHETTKLPESFSKIRLSQTWNEKVETQEYLSNLLFKVLLTLDKYVGQIFKETDAFIEISEPFSVLINHLIRYNQHPVVINLATKLKNISKIAAKERKPLKLQAHRAVAIPTYAPRFEENYNPDKKSYDSDMARQEISKLRHQIKQERKQALREIRKDTRFEARAQIEKKKTDYEEYHSKMAKIYNSIQTEEGAAKNEYEREKRSRKNRK